MTNSLSTKKVLSVLASSFLGAALVLTLSTQASADELGGTAREQARAGKQAYESGDFRRASLKFELAYAAQKTPVIALWRARVARAEGRFEKALRLYEQALKMCGDPNCKMQARVRIVAKAERQDLLLSGGSSVGRAALASSR